MLSHRLWIIVPRAVRIGGLLAALAAACWLLPGVAAAAPLGQQFDVTKQCFAISDEPAGAPPDPGGIQPDTLVRLDRATAQSFVIGLTGTRNIETMTFGPNEVLYAVDGGQLGTVDLMTAVFTPLTAPFGTAQGSVGQIALNDIDSLAYDFTQNIFYAVHRRNGPGQGDLLFAADPVTGVHIDGLFGGQDYVVVPPIFDENNVLLDGVDDIAIDPITGVMYGAVNTGGLGGVLARIDPLSGNATRVATFHYPDPYPTNPALAGAVIDDIEGLSFFNDGRLYASTGNNGPDANDLNRLFRIDEMSGEGTLIGSFPTSHQDYEALGCQIAQASVELVKYTHGPGQTPQDADLPTGPTIHAGDTVIWTYVFTNTGVLTLTDLALEDDQIGVVGPGGLSNCPPAGTILGPGEAFTCTATGTAQPGQYANIGQITGLTEEGLIVPRRTVSDTNPSHYFGESPEIEIQKLTNGFDANDPNGADVPSIAPGDPVIWTYVVMNTGNVPLSQADIEVSDDQVGPITTIIDQGDGDATLAPGEVWVYQATGTAQDLLVAAPPIVTEPGCDPANSGLTRPAYVNIGMVQAGDLAAIDPSHYCNPPAPGLVLKKLTNGADADDPNGADVPLVAPGDPVIWTYIVTNTGNVPFALADLALVDNRLGPVTTITDQGDGDTILSPGEAWIYRATGSALDLTSPDAADVTVPGCDPDQSGVDRPAYANLGRITAGDLAAEDPSHYCNPPAPVPVPGLVLEKLTNGFDADDPNGADVPLVAPGDPVIWTYIVTNTGDVPFPQASLVLTDDQVGLISTIIDQGDGNAVLDPGEAWVYQATGTAEDLSVAVPPVRTVLGCDPGQSGLTRPAYSNLGRVTAGGLADEDPSHYCNPPAPGLVLEKLTNGADADDPNGADVPLIRPGDPVIWTYVVTNTGNVPFALADLALVDNRLGAVTAITDQGDGDATLDPGEVWTYRATGSALDLTSPSAEDVTVPGCDPDQSGVDRPAYANLGRVTAGDLTAEDPSHYCNPPVVIPPLTAVGDLVWIDTNRNGLQDAGEVGSAGVTVNLYSALGAAAEGDPLSTTQTDSTGFYAFRELPLGSYYVEFVPPAGFVFTQPNVGSNEAIDSDAVVPQMALTLDDGRGVAQLGRPLTYTVTYTNPDTLQAATGVVLSTTVPAGTTANLAASTPGWDCGAGQPVAGTVCRLAAGTLAAGETATARLVVVLGTDGDSVPRIINLIVRLTHTTPGRSHTTTPPANGIDRRLDAGLVVGTLSLQAQQGTVREPNVPTDLDETDQPGKPGTLYLPSLP